MARKRSRHKKGKEFFYLDKDGKPQDATLHDAILEGGDHQAALQVTKAVARRAGISEEVIARLYPDE